MILMGWSWNNILCVFVEGAIEEYVEKVFSAWGSPIAHQIAGGTAICHFPVPLNWKFEQVSEVLFDFLRVPVPKQLSYS